MDREKSKDFSNGRSVRLKTLLEVSNFTSLGRACQPACLADGIEALLHYPRARKTPFRIPKASLLSAVRPIDGEGELTADFKPNSPDRKGSDDLWAQGICDSKGL